ncbi:MAG: SMR family transporter [Leptonema sp. (in: bacteria)]
MTFFTLIMLLLAIILNALANILVKASAVYIKSESLFELITNYYLIAGLLSFGFAFIAYRYVLSKGFALSIAYPIMTTAGFAIVILASNWLFQEKINTLQWIGIGFLIIGIWLITYNN